jgi:cation diffusion facilitator CzcD-associated flavoprotein CzcO
MHEHAVVIVGSGFGGLCAAIRLIERGVRDLVILERGPSVGGTWRDNTYPGAACDVPSHLYSLSFAPNPAWSRTYPTQPELRAYLERLAADRGLLPYCRFGEDMVDARWDEGRERWRVTTSRAVYSARAVVAATGGLAEPKLPDLPGLGNFRGATFHSARWDHAAPLEGKRVAVIGTGASAVQFVPAIAPRVGHLDVYQRTPNWIVPRRDTPYSPATKWAFAHVPGLRLAYRAAIYGAHELRVLGFVTHPGILRAYQAVALAHLRRQVDDPALRRALTPDYTLGCKRVLVSNDWYPALRRPNVSLVTDGIREIREHAVVTTDGAERPADVLIFGTGFHATESPVAARVRGRGGVSLAEAWRDGEEAFRGTLVHGFPNLFLVVGPNTGLGHSSMVYMIEAQVDYIVRLLAHAEARGADVLEVTAAAQARYNRALQARLAGSVWATGCRSWYRHRSGKITALWPGFTFGFRRALRGIDPADYRQPQGGETPDPPPRT